MLSLIFEVLKFFFLHSNSFFKAELPIIRSSDPNNAQHHMLHDVLLCTVQSHTLWATESYAL